MTSMVFSEWQTGQWKVLGILTHVHQQKKHILIFLYVHATYEDPTIHSIIATTRWIRNYIPLL